ncbi:MAG: cystathionine beta-lyase [Caulobacteraceae bacterium]
MKEETRVQHLPPTGIGANRPVNPPVERASTLLFPDAAEVYASPKTSVVYGIQGLTVQRQLAAALAEIERGPHVVLAPSGLAAMTLAIMAVTKAGEEILVTDAAYGPTRKFCDSVMERFGVTTRYYPPTASAADIEAMLTPATRLIVLETPGSLTFEFIDVPAICVLARRHNVLTLVDNSWAAGVLFKPLEAGADLSMQAVSKYAGGHADLLMGSVTAKDPALGAKLFAAYDEMGWFVSPDDAYLALRGMRTLHVRLKHQEASGLTVARWLADQPEVARVLHPALQACPGHDIWKRDFTGSNGLFGVVMRGGTNAAAEALLDALQLFGKGFSWGGFESLAIHCDRQLKGRTFKPELEGQLLRLNIGLEDPADLIADLETGLTAWRAAL